jgi:hypothetical protein
MCWFGEVELVEQILELQKEGIPCLWFFYRDVMLQAKERGLVQIIGDSEDHPFWRRTFEESIEFTPKAIEMITRKKFL